METEEIKTILKKDFIDRSASFSMSNAEIDDAVSSVTEVLRECVESKDLKLAMVVAQGGIVAMLGQIAIRLGEPKA